MSYSGIGHREASDCLVCGKPLEPESTLTLGTLSACNDFVQQRDAAASVHALAIAECTVCGLVQLSGCAPAAFVRPKVSWIGYSEPDSHLGVVADEVRRLITGCARSALGVGPFDPTLLGHLEQRGFSCASLQLADKLPDFPGRYPYLESIQELLRPDVLGDLALVHGASDLVCCRYLLEHSHDPVATLRGLRMLLGADGYLLVEVPDCTKFLSNLDYSFVWEEHISYFSEHTLRTCAMQAGFQIAAFVRSVGMLEDAMVAILRPQVPLQIDSSLLAGDRSSDLFQRFRSGFQPVRNSYARSLQAFVDTGRKVVVFGAGHQSIMFINALQLQPFISFVIDDDPHKRQHLVPGTDIRIVDSELLESDPDIGLCLLGVSPAAAIRIRTKFASFLHRGGLMYSIFPASGDPLLVGSNHGETCEADQEIR